MVLTFTILPAKKAHAIVGVANPLTAQAIVYLATALIGTGATAAAIATWDETIGGWSFEGELYQEAKGIYDSMSPQMQSDLKYAVDSFKYTGKMALDQVTGLYAVYKDFIYNHSGLVDVISGFNEYIVFSSSPDAYVDVYITISDYTEEISVHLRTVVQGSAKVVYKSVHGYVYDSNRVIQSINPLPDYTYVSTTNDQFGFVQNNEQFILDWFVSKGFYDYLIGQKDYLASNLVVLNTSGDTAYTGVFPNALPETIGETTVPDERTPDREIAIPGLPLNPTAGQVYDGLNNKTATDLLDTLAGQTTADATDTVGLDSGTVDLNNVADSISGNFDINVFKSTMERLTNFDTSTPPPPKVEIDLNALARAGSAISGYTDNIFPQDKYTLFDFSILEDYTFQGMTLVQLIRYIISMNMILMTLLYCYRRIIPDKAVN